MHGRFMNSPPEVYHATQIQGLTVTAVRVGEPPARVEERLLQRHGLVVVVAAELHLPRDEGVAEAVGGGAEELVHRGGDGGGLGEAGNIVYWSSSISDLGRVHRAEAALMVSASLASPSVTSTSLIGRPIWSE